jgi:hypothetical protein
VGLETEWGGSIVEVSLNGVNFVNWPDVQTVWASAPVNCGYQCSLDTKAYANAPHTILVAFTDTAGNAAPMPIVPVSIGN